MHDGVKVIFNVRKQRERHSFSEAGARYKKNHDFLRSSWWFSAFVKKGASIQDVSNCNKEDRVHTKLGLERVCTGYSFSDALIYFTIF